MLDRLIAWLTGGQELDFGLLGAEWEHTGIVDTWNNGTTTILGEDMPQELIP